MTPPRTYAPSAENLRPLVVENLRPMNDGACRPLVRSSSLLARRLASKSRRRAAGQPP